MQPADVSQRERNRARTWDAIHSTASALVLEKGLATVTVDEIAERAEVSRRTFFNYFATKEDAVLGTRAATLDPAALREYEASTDDALARTVRLMRAVVQSALHEPERFETRRELMRRHPELRVRLSEHVRSGEAIVVDVIEADGLPEHATVALVMLAGTVMRFAHTFDADAEGTAPDGDAAIEQAITQFRAILKAVL